MQLSGLHIPLAHKSEAPRYCEYRGASLGLLSLVVTVKPLAQVVGGYLRCNGHKKICQDCFQWTHLPSVARVGKGQHDKYNTKSCKTRQYRAFYTQLFLFSIHIKSPASLCAEAGLLIQLPFRDLDQKKGKRRTKLVGAKPLHLLSQTVWSLESPTGAFVADANAIYLSRCGAELVSCQCACTAAG